MGHYHFIRSIIETIFVVFWVYLALGFLAVLGITILPPLMFTPLGIFVLSAFLFGNFVIWWRN